MSLQQKAYERIEAARQNFPDETISSLMKRLKVKPFNYYAGKRKFADGAAAISDVKRAEPVKAASKRGRLKRTAQVAVTGAGQLVLIMGTPDQLREFVGRLA